MRAKAEALRFGVPGVVLERSGGAGLGPNVAAGSWCCGWVLVRRGLVGGGLFRVVDYQGVDWALGGFEF